MDLTQCPQTHSRTHCGQRRFVAEVRRTYHVPTSYLVAVWKDVKSDCSHCGRNITPPKSLPSKPTKPILSTCFAERIIFGTKTLPHERGYVLVAVDHFSGYTMCEHTTIKQSDYVAAFMRRVIDAFETQALEATLGGAMYIHPVSQDGDEKNGDTLLLKKVRRLCPLPLHWVRGF